jgi:hypothetical protein
LLAVQHLLLDVKPLQLSYITGVNDM